MAGMSPYPVQVERAALLQKARAMMEAEGIDNLTLHKLAAAFSIKAPSLYRHFSSKADLLRAVNLDTNKALVDSIRLAVAAAQPQTTARIRAMAAAYRAFALANPMTYGLMYSNLSAELRPDPAQLEALALPLQALITPITGEADSLAALRGVWALVHGFIMLELNGQFQRGGDLEAAYMQAVEAYIRGWTKQV
jgi:AcrR family transcriptional regulator